VLRRLSVLCALALAVTACGGGSPRTPAPSTATGSGPTSARTSPAHSTAPGPTPRSSPTPRGRPLPLPYRTADARQVVTVVAAGETATIAALQRWTRSGTGWRRVGRPVAAWLGSAGLTRRPNESTAATPEGSFTLTRAFGRLGDPGTALPYRETTPDDWWISEAGPLYNTYQRCAADCAFTQGDPNEHLYAITPLYDHAVVIDYNTRNSPSGVRQGAGSAFFLHVSGGEPTAGCVAIPADALVRVLRWLLPSDRPRILIGVEGTSRAER
jgi:L,D-peptidoglycan transpeptidase YkuD (ErfK/YbiS/YcfS/YnhG family)